MIDEPRLVIEAETAQHPDLAVVAAIVLNLDYAITAWATKEGGSARFALSEARAGSLLVKLAAILEGIHALSDLREYLGGFILSLKDAVELLMARRAPQDTAVQAAARAVEAVATPVATGNITIINIFVEGDNDPAKWLTIDRALAHAILGTAEPEPQAEVEDPANGTETVDSSGIDDDFLSGTFEDELYAEPAKKRGRHTAQWPMLIGTPFQHAGDWYVRLEDDREQEFPLRMPAGAVHELVDGGRYEFRSFGPSPNGMVLARTAKRIG